MGTGVHIHTLRLSDEFRRNAIPTDTDDAFYWEVLVGQVKELGSIAQMFEDDLKGFYWRNFEVLELIKAHMDYMVDTCDALGKKKMILPFAKTSPIAQSIAEYILDPDGVFYQPNLFKRFDFMPGPYARDLSHLGPVNRRAETVFDRDTRSGVDLAPGVR